MSELKRGKGRPKKTDKITRFMVYFRESVVAKNGGKMEFRSKIEAKFGKK